MDEFFKTQMGKRFYESDIPKISRALESISKSLETIVNMEKAANGNFNDEEKGENG